MDKQAWKPPSSAQWVDFLARGGKLSELRQLDPNQLDAMYTVAHGRYSSGHYDEALKVFRYLCLLDHTSYRYFLGLGLTQARLSQFSQAAATLSHAEKLDSRDPRASLVMGECFLELKQKVLAAQALSVTIRRAKAAGRWQKELAKARQLANYVGVNPGRG